LRGAKLRASQCRPRQCSGYFVRRKENAEALTDLAIDSFIEMRGKTALIMHNYASILHALGLIQ